MPAFGYYKFVITPEFGRHNLPIKTKLISTDLLPKPSFAVNRRQLFDLSVVDTSLDLNL
jgi:hypothetical protein